MPQLAAKESCTGCSACVHTCPKSCIRMNADADGFLFPLVSEEACIHCGLCEKVCPIRHLPIPEEGETVAYAAYVTDPVIRAESSSGGIFSALALQVLAKEGAVFGAAYDSQFDVRHICAENSEDLARLRGAKYAQSELGNTFRNVRERLDRGQHVLFSGTPCQVAGLKSFLRKDYDNLICVDFVCHGVPSPMAWHKYVRFRSNMDSGGQLPQRINLRSKDTGWSRYAYSNVFSYPNGKKYACTSGESLFMRLFVGDHINRLSCAQCAFKGYRRVSDITLGDFWGIWDIAPELDDNKGTSLILLHSDKGQRIFTDIQASIVCKPMTLAQASAQNASLLVSAKTQPDREEILALLRREDFDALQTRFPKPVSRKPSLLIRIKAKMKKMLTSLR